jgi:hypothetical protein
MDIPNAIISKPAGHPFAEFGAHFFRSYRLVRASRPFKIFNAPFFVC